MRQYTPILDFWFGDAEEHQSSTNRRWFGGEAGTDRAIGDRFEADVVTALAGGHTDWAADAHGRLALILLLDQFTRNLYRGTARAFAGDARAVSLCRSGLVDNFPQELGLFEQAFFLMPLQHSESPDDQQSSASAFAALAEAAPSHLKRAANTFARHAREHREIIQRFGRFPHRNAVLGRTSTDAEKTYLVDAPTYGQ